MAAAGIHRLHPNGQSPEMATAEIASPPQETEGFSLPDLSNCEWGDIDLEPIYGQAKIARAKVNWQFRQPKVLYRENPVIITHGYIAKAGAYDDLADYLASHGVATATYDAQLRQGLLAGYSPKHWNPERLVCQEPWGVVRDIRNRRDIKPAPNQFTFVGHSMGVRTAVKNAHVHPEHVDGIIGIDGAGITDGDNFASYLMRVPKFFGHEIIPGAIKGDISREQAAALAIGGLSYIVGEPVKALAQGISIGNANIKPAIKALRESGIGSALIVSNKDRLVPADKAEEAAGQHTDTADIFLRMPFEDLGHMGPLKHPEIYGQAILHILDHFDLQKTQDSAEAA